MKFELSSVLGATLCAATLLGGTAGAQSVTGAATPYGNTPVACPGSGPSEGLPILNLNPGTAGGVLLNIEGIHAFGITLPTPMVVTGFEIPPTFGSGDPRGEPLVRAFLYLGTAKGGPIGPPVREGLIYLHLGPATGPVPLQRARFRPLSLRAGEVLYVAWEQTRARSTLLPYSNSFLTTPLPFFVENGSGGFKPGPHQAPLVVSLIGPGSAPGPGGTPLLSASGEPRKGKVFSLWVDQANAGVGALIIGVRRYGFGAPNQPLLLPGTTCNLLASVDVLQPFVIPAGGAANLPFLVPDDARLVGGTFYMHSAVLDPRANSFGLTTSQGLAVKVGG